MSDKPLGRRAPTDDEHIRKYPLRALGAVTPAIVNRSLRLPYWHWGHDQGSEGSCVGHGAAMERAITNTQQNIVVRILGAKSRRYDPIDLWDRAKEVDEWPDTNPGDSEGTSVRAAYDVLRSVGPCRVRSMRMVGGSPVALGVRPRDLSDGCEVNRWATTVDEMRASIHGGAPVVIGVSWYANFDRPEAVGAENWIGRGDLGRLRGGHCVTIYAASDRRDAFRVKNSWGRSYPLVWLPYTTMERLLREDGEATLLTDR